MRRWWPRRRPRLARRGDGVIRPGPCRRFTLWRCRLCRGRAPRCDAWMQGFPHAWRRCGASPAPSGRMPLASSRRSPANHVWTGLSAMWRCAPRKAAVAELRHCRRAVSAAFAPTPVDWRRARADSTTGSFSDFAPASARGPAEAVTTGSRALSAVRFRVGFMLGHRSVSMLLDARRGARSVAPRPRSSTLCDARRSAAAVRGSVSSTLTLTLTIALSRESCRWVDDSRLAGLPCPEEPGRGRRGFRGRCASSSSRTPDVPT